ALKTRHRSRHGGERENVVNAAQVGFGRHHSRGQQALDFGCEQEPVPLSRPVKRTDAEAVATKSQLMPTHVPQGHGELAAQALEQAFVILFPHVWNDFRVAMRDEAMSSRYKLRMLFWVIEQLAVEDHKDAPVFIGDRLLAIRQADNAKPPGGQRQPRTL